MNEKECPRILRDAERIKVKTPSTIAWISRLSSELATGFCVGRVCSECPVSRVRKGEAGISLTAREMAVSATTGALVSEISVYDDEYVSAS